MGARDEDRRRGADDDVRAALAGPAAWPVKLEVLAGAARRDSAAKREYFARYFADSTLNKVLQNADELRRTVAISFCLTIHSNLLVDTLARRA